MSNQAEAVSVIRAEIRAQKIAKENAFAKSNGRNTPAVFKYQGAIKMAENLLVKLGEKP